MKFQVAILVAALLGSTSAQQPNNCPIHQLLTQSRPNSNGVGLGLNSNLQLPGLNGQLGGGLQNALSGIQGHLNGDIQNGMRGLQGLENQLGGGLNSLLGRINGGINGRAQLGTGQQLRNRVNQKNAQISGSVSEHWNNAMSALERDALSWDGKFQPAFHDEVHRLQNEIVKILHTAPENAPKAMQKMPDILKGVQRLSQQSEVPMEEMFEESSSAIGKLMKSLRDTLGGAVSSIGNGLSSVAGSLGLGGGAGAGGNTRLGGGLDLGVGGGSGGNAGLSASAGARANAGTGGSGGIGGFLGQLGGQLGGLIPSVDVNFG